MCVRGEIATGEESVGALKELIIDPMEKTRERGKKEKNSDEFYRENRRDRIKRVLSVPPHPFAQLKDYALP